MKPVVSSLLAVLLTSVMAAPQAADSRERSINQRQHNQQFRIREGVRQGELTRGEATRLQREARDVRREAQAFRSDGRFTAAERREVQWDLDRLSRHTARERHDDQRRFSNDWRYPGVGYGPGHRQPGPAWGYPGLGYGHAYGHSSTRAFDNRVDRIQHDQRQRIAQGLRSGALTRAEANRLIAEQRAIEAEERRYLADGVVTRAERADLLQDLFAAARSIYNESHDFQTRR